MAYTWAQFKSAVLTFLTDRAPSDDAFVEAVAEYVLARVAQNLAGDDKLYALHENKYRSLRRRTAGFQTTLDDATLRSRVRALICDTTAGDNLLVQAIAYFVKAEMYRSLIGDQAAADSQLKSYQQLRVRLTGLTTALDASTLRTRVRALVTDATLSDNLFVQAASHYVKAEIARSLIGDAAVADAQFKSYSALRVRLMGFPTSLDLSTLKSRVKVLVTDTTASNALYVQAVSYFVKAEISREVNRDPELAESFRKSYVQLRARLVGFTYTGGTLRTEVDKLLPVDKDRSNIKTDYINALVASAQADLTGMAAFLDGLIVSAKDDLEGMTTWLDAGITSAKDDIAGLATWINAEIAAAKADLNGLNDRVQKEIRQGVIDLQHYVDLYRTGHETTFTEDDVEQRGYASVGTLPDQAQVRDAYIVYETYLNGQIHRDQVEAITWYRRQDIVGAATAKAKLVIAPDGKTFFCSPQLSIPDGINLLLIWDGLKLDFADGDTTPFDEGAVKAVGAWVQAELAAELGDAANSIRAFREDYVRMRLRLYTESRDRQSLRGSDNLDDNPSYPVSANDPVP